MFKLHSKLLRKSREPFKLVFDIFHNIRNGAFNYFRNASITTANRMISLLFISCEQNITRKINMEGLKFCSSSEKKKWNNKIWLKFWLSKIIQSFGLEFFYVTIFTIYKSLSKKWLKMILFCLKIFCIHLTSPNDPFLK